MTLTYLLLAAALVVSAPAPVARIRDRGDCAGAGRTSVSPAWIPVGVGAVALAAFALGRAGVVIAGALAGTTAVHTVAARRRARADRTRAELAADFIGHLAESVRAGSTLAAAAERAASKLPVGTAPAEPAALVRDAARFVAAAQQGKNPQDVATPELQRVAELWALSSSRGVPIADLLTTARDEIDHALRHRAATDAALAGPKTTATVLSLLPLAGIAMGAAMGANPVSFLTGPGLGAVLLVVGTALVCAGVVGSGEIIRRAAA